jgi:alkylhydroperoxidase/carboxymuconolactone decarboxylase family protein YurZ
MKKVLKIALLFLSSLCFSCAAKNNLPTGQPAALGGSHPSFPNALNAKEQSIVTISAFTAQGDMTRLKRALTSGLDNGLTVSEIKEVLTQLYAYSGFPRSLNALGAFMEVLEVRRGEGISYVAGKDANPLPKGKSSLELGTENQPRLAGGPLYTFAPTVDYFLKSHLFGDIFGRDNLDFIQREIATISALASMDGVVPQLKSHLRVGFNAGLTENQLHGIAAVLAADVGTKEALNAVFA